MAADPDFVEYVLEQLQGTGEITHKAMFGGHGFWERGDMFALVSSESVLYFKADDNTRPAFESAGAQQFMNMPYWSVPADVLEDQGQFRTWVDKAINVGHATAKRSKKRS